MKILLIITFITFSLRFLLITAIKGDDKTLASLVLGLPTKLGLLLALISLIMYIEFFIVGIMAILMLFN